MKKRMDLAFCLVFVAMLALPAIFTNFRTDQASETDNTYLPEINWQEKASARVRIHQIEKYVNMRVGFREDSLLMYQLLNDRLFHELQHPRFMYGKDGWIFYGYDAYVEDYQHLNLTRRRATRFARWMKSFSTLAADRGIDFYYLLIPDKKTVYPEYFPDGYNVKSHTSRTDQILAALDKEGVAWMYAYDTLVGAKDRFLVANKKYDAGHWNANGAFVVCQALVEWLRQRHPEIPPISQDEFEVGVERQPYLHNSRFPIDEDVPTYTLKQMQAEADADRKKSLTKLITGDKYCHCYVNPNHPELPRLLVLMDSYFVNRELFFVNRFSEVTFIHRDNILGPRRFEEFLDAVQPDIVVYENPERCFPIHFSKKS